MAKHLVKPLAREGQYRCEHQLQVVDTLERDVEDSCRSLAIRLDDVPRLLLAQVLVDESGQPHRLGDRSLEPRLAVQRSDTLEASLDG